MPHKVYSVDNYCKWTVTEDHRSLKKATLAEIFVVTQTEMLMDTLKVVFNQFCKTEKHTEKRRKRGTTTSRSRPTSD